MSKALGTTLNLEYQNAASGAVAMQLLAAAKDCNTVVSSAHPKVVLGQIIQQAYDFENDFVTLGAYTRDYATLMVLNDSTYKSAQDLVDDAKTQPGKITVAVGSLAADGLPVFALQEVTGTEFNIVSLGGGTEANNALLGGKAPVAESSVFNGLALAGKAHPLLVMGPENPAPDQTDNAPTANEALGVNLEPQINNYVLYVSKTCKQDHPAEFQALSDALKNALDDADFKSTVESLGLSAWYSFTPPEDMDKTILESIPKIEQMVSKYDLAGKS
jgi:tripartite-type tricarboxylate transporter receptor subunit TctC